MSVLPCALLSSHILSFRPGRASHGVHVPDGSIGQVIHRVPLVKGPLDLVKMAQDGVIAVLGRLKQGDWKFKDNLGSRAKLFEK